MGDDRGLYAAECTLLAIAVLAWVVFLLVRRLQRSRPGLGIGLPIAVAAGLRIAVAALASAIPRLGQLRGPDEKGYLVLAHRLAQDLDALGSVPAAITHDLHVWFTAGQIAVLGPDAGDFSLRVTQITLAVAAIALIAVAANDLAGPQAALLVAWILALEPGGMFYAGLMLKESLVYLGEAIVIFGCVRMYLRRDVTATVLMAAGLLVVGFVRPHVCAALALACIVVMLHAALRHPGIGGRVVTLLFVTVVAVAGAAIAVPRLDEFRRNLQSSQSANVTDNSNLRLDPVDFSSPRGVVHGTLQRTFDFLVRPYPWQLANTSQRFGVTGTLVVWALLLLALVLVARHPQRLPRAAPLAYLAVCLTVAYAVTTGNAGTGFRYRTHVLVALAVCVSVLAVRRTGPEHAVSLTRGAVQGPLKIQRFMLGKGAE